ncbi:hypothetical protein FB547_104111 [Variovorax beijingensis]|uniref:Uncharacterized protein n=2 Tax=Variovorax TaxID=34072 RepID=A0AAE3Y2B7_VARPD|nr:MULTISPECIES: hypothetical protein [Variovorax]MDR6428205.1 hypothetical protein [Variovorax paradoxus]TWD86169.1 hypothetical protein FB547_104111 [Variovorax beijingensis]
MPAPSNPESRALAKLAWEAAWERLGNALQPPAGYPPATPEQLAECFEVAQARLDEVRAAYGVPQGR